MTKQTDRPAVVCVLAHACSPLVSTSIATVYSKLNRIDKRLIIKGFTEETHGPEALRSGFRAVVAPGHDDDWNLEVTVEERLLHLQAAHSGHVHIYNDAVVIRWPLMVEERLTRGESAYGIACGLQQPGYCAPDRRIIIDYVDQLGNL